MAYQVTLSNGTTIITIQDNSIDTVQTSVGLVGKNASNYGQTIASNTLRMLENFAANAAPSQPLIGQMWFDTQNEVLKVYNGSTWLELIMASGIGVFEIQGDVEVSGEVTANLFIGDLQGNASSSSYADLAERYESDSIYDAGTVVKIGGMKEVTQTTSEACKHVFGVISDKPGFMLNSQAGTDKTHPYVALAGRVGVKVKGPVKKGWRLIASSEPGVAVAIDDSKMDMVSPYAVFGRALEDNNSSDVKLVLSVVGVN